MLESRRTTRMIPLSRRSPMGELRTRPVAPELPCDGHRRHQRCRRPTIVREHAILSVNVKAKRNPPRVAKLRHFLERMKARCLYISVTSLKPQFSVERGSAYHFHRLLDRSDSRTCEDRAAGHDAIGRVLVRIHGGGRVEHIAMGKSRGR